MNSTILVAYLNCIGRLMKVHEQIYFKQHPSKGGILTIIPWQTTLFQKTQANAEWTTQVILESAVLGGMEPTPSIDTPALYLATTAPRRYKEKVTQLKWNRNAWTTIACKRIIPITGYDLHSLAKEKKSEFTCT